MDVSSKETVNSFNSGLNTDIDNSLIPKNQYRDALNMRVVASSESSASTLQPYTGFNEKLDIEPLAEYTIISTISIRNYIVTFEFLKNRGEIGNLPIDRFAIKRYDTDLNTQIDIISGDNLTHDYNENSKFSCVARYEDSDNIKIYWADGVNPIRMINISNAAQQYNDDITNVEQFNIKPLVNTSKPRFKDFGTGSLLSGKIQYAYYFYNKNGQQTEISVPSELISLTTVSDTDGSYFNIKGDKLDQNTNKSCIIEFDTPVGEYQRVKIISIHYDDNSSTPKIRLVGDIKLENLSTTTFIDFGTTVLAEYTVDEFNLISGINFSAKYIESKNNYLFAGNITKIDWDIDYDARAYRANLGGYVKLMSSVGNDLEFKLQNNIGEFSPINVSDSQPTVIPFNHDCINPYNDLNKEYIYFKDRGVVGALSESIEFNPLYKKHSPQPHIYTYNKKIRSLNFTEGDFNTVLSLALGELNISYETKVSITEKELLVDFVTSPTLVLKSKLKVNYTANNIIKVADITLEQTSLQATVVTADVAKFKTDNIILDTLILYPDLIDTDQINSIELYDISIENISGTNINIINNISDPVAIYYQYSQGYVSYITTDYIEVVGESVIDDISIIEELYIQITTTIDGDLNLKMSGNIDVSNTNGDRMSRCVIVPGHVTQHFTPGPSDEWVYFNGDDQDITFYNKPAGMYTIFARSSYEWLGHTDQNVSIDLLDVRIGEIGVVDTDTVKVYSTDSIDVAGVTDALDNDKFAYINQYDGSTHKSIKFGGIGPNIKYEFIWTEIELDEASNPASDWDSENQISRSYAAYKNDNTLAVLSKKSFEGLWHFDQDGCVIHSKDIDGGVELKDRFCDYSNTYINLKYQSLHRDELYRYGIQFYNKYGVKSTVKWIGDIRTPHKLDRIIKSDNKEIINTFCQPFGNNELISFKSNGDIIETGLKARPLGIRFTVGNIDSLIADGVTGYEIVRVKRSIKDKSILSQGYSSKLYLAGSDGMKMPMIYPTLSDRNTTYTNSHYIADNSLLNHTYNLVDKVDNVVQFVSPDTCYSSASFASTLDSLNIYSSIIGIYGSIVTKESYNVPYTNIPDYMATLNEKYTITSHVLSATNLTGYGTLIQASTGPSYNQATDYYSIVKGNAFVGNSYENYTATVTSLNTSYYYSDLYYNSGQFVLGTNSKQVNDVKQSVNFGWNNRLDNKLYTDIYGSTVYNYNYDDENVFGPSYPQAGAAQGPSSPSLFISEQVGDTNRLSNKYIDIAINLKGFNTVRQSDIIRNSNLTLGNITNSTVKSIVNTYNKNYKASTLFYGHCPYYDIALVNLKQTVNPYNGNTYQSRQYSTYTSISCYNNINDLTIKPNYYVDNTSVIDTFNGDTFLCIFDNQRNHTVYTTTANVPEQLQRMSVNFRIPVETSINLTLTNGPEIHRNTNPNIQIEPSVITSNALIPNGYTQTEPLHQYNSAYSAISDVVIDTVRNELDELDKKLDTRIVYSEQKINDEIQDSWTIFKTNNFLEVDNRYGSLTNLKLFKNQLLAFQENALSQLAVKERTILQDNNIGGLVLGTGDILERYDYITTNYGIAPDQSKVIIDTESALYWFDHYRNQILGYSGQLDLLSKKKYIQSYLNTHTTKDYPVAVYNRELNDVMFNLFTDTVRPTIAFNEQIDAFSSFYSIDFIDGETVNGKTYLIKDSGTISIPNKYHIIEYNTKDTNGKDLVNEFLDDKDHESSITYVVNEGYDQTKIFDNVEFNGSYPFTHTEIQYEVDGKKSYTIDSSDIQNRELTYKYAIPRIISGEDIPDRVRGNYTECTFKITPDGKLFRIPYFKTKFRTSKS